jgi:hypothetical protein
MHLIQVLKIFNVALPLLPSFLMEIDLRATHVDF